MPNPPEPRRFDVMFEQSLGKPIKVDDRLVSLIDKLDVGHLAVLTVRIASWDRTWRQGIRLDCNGTFEVNGCKISRATALWADTAPSVVEVTVLKPKGDLIVSNIWDTGNGVMERWSGNSGMLIERNGDTVAYRCNDRRHNEDFEDIVFSIEVKRQTSAT